MIVVKVSVGYVRQSWDTEKKAWVSQEFVAANESDYEDDCGNPLDSDLIDDGKDREPYLPFDMVQPEVPQNKEGLVSFQVPVKFTGVVEVLVPKGLRTKNARELAKNLALSRIIATINNPDAPDDDAFSDYCSETNQDEDDERVSEKWDASIAEGVGGGWTAELPPMSK